MYCQTRSDTSKRYYRCSSREAGFECEQGSIITEILDEQVAAILLSLKPPPDWNKHIMKTIGEILGEQRLEERLTEIHVTIERMDFRWDNGFIVDRADYLEKRLKLQQELEQLSPVQEELNVAADVLGNFEERWKSCDGDLEKQHQLVKLIVERAYVEDNAVVAITLKSNYHVVLGHNANEPTYMEVDPMVHEWARRDSNP